MKSGGRKPKQMRKLGLGEEAVGRIEKALEERKAATDRRKNVDPLDAADGRSGKDRRRQHN